MEDPIGSKDERDFELVHLETAPSPPIAEMLLEMLQDRGIPAYVNGRLLQDEWAISQILLGRVGVSIQVPRKHLEAAKKILAEAREAGREMETEEATDPDGE
jgi:hypothetical protein